MSEKELPGAHNLSVIDPWGGPLIFFERASNFGHLGEIISVTLAAGRHLLDANGTPVSNQIAVAHLRCTKAAAASLIAALEKALLAATPTSETKN